MELTIENIQNILDVDINPMLKLHSGSCSIDSLDKENQVLTVNLLGGCAGCPSSKITLYNGIVPIFKESFPELQIDLA